MCFVRWLKKSPKKAYKRVIHANVLDGCFNLLHGCKELGIAVKVLGLLGCCELTGWAGRGGAAGLDGTRGLFGRDDGGEAEPLNNDRTTTWASTRRWRRWWSGCGRTRECRFGGWWRRCVVAVLTDRRRAGSVEQAGPLPVPGEQRTLLSARKGFVCLFDGALWFSTLVIRCRAGQL